MKAVIQRVKQAQVSVAGQVVSKIDSGLLILLGVAPGDTQEDIEWLSGKIARLRIFSDQDGNMNNSIVDESGEAIVVSQFTLHASTKKGNRPSFLNAAKPEFAQQMYKQFISSFQAHLNTQVGTGVFGAMMDVQLVNDGPVTIIIDTKNKE